MHGRAVNVQRRPNDVGEQTKFTCCAYLMSSYCSPNFACTCRRHMFVAKDRAQACVGRAAPEAVTLSLQSCARAGATPIPLPITINDADNATAHANILTITTPISLRRNTQRHYSRSHLAQSASRTVATGVSQIILSLELNILRRSHRGAASSGCDNHHTTSR